jgi:hypothetical protein
MNQKFDAGYFSQMKTILLVVMLLCIVSMLNAQPDQQTSIQINGRIITVSRDSSGNWKLPESLCVMLVSAEEKRQETINPFLWILMFYLNKQNNTGEIKN